MPHPLYTCTSSVLALIPAVISSRDSGTYHTSQEGEMTGEMRGIIPRTVEDIFTYIVNDPEPSSKYLVR